MESTGGCALDPFSALAFATLTENQVDWRLAVLQSSLERCLFRNTLDRLFRKLLKKNKLRGSSATTGTRQGENAASMTSASTGGAAAQAAPLHELDAARKAKRDEFLLSRIAAQSSASASTSLPRDVRQLTGLRNASNALVFRFLCYVCDHLKSVDASGNLSKAVGVACRAVRNTEVTVHCGEKAMEIKGIGPHLANMLDRSLFTLYPQDAPPDEREEAARGRARGEASTAPPGRKPKKAYRPKNGTANYAFLVCMHKLLLEGQDFVLKQDLIRIAESSGLSSKSIHGTANASNAHNRCANWYNGWSSFLQMVKRDPPLVYTWSSPLKCRLTKEGEALAEDLHRNAHERHMCSCSLLENAKARSTSDGAGGQGQAFPRGLDTAAGEENPGRGPEKRRGAAMAAEFSTKRHRPKALAGESGRDSACRAQDPCPPQPITTTRNDGAVVTPSAYEDHLEAYRHEVTKSDLRLPPLEENQAFADVYEIVLFLDNREQLRGSNNMASAGSCQVSSSQQSTGRRSRAENLQFYTKALTDSGLKVEIGKLAVGDVTWLARRKKSTPSSAGAAPEASIQEAYVLDYIMERKSVDDLIDSIRSNRYGMQKHLLKRSGVAKVFYLIEGNIDAHNNAQAARTACLRLKTQDNFTVLRTAGVNATISAYKNLTRAVEKLYSNMRGPVPAEKKCMTLGDLGRTIGAERKLTLSDVFRVQLQHIPGIGRQVADAIVRKFPTPMTLWKDAIVSEETGEPSENLAEMAAQIKFVPLSPGLTYRTVGNIKAIKILDFLFNTAASNE